MSSSPLRSGGYRLQPGGSIAGSVRVPGDKSISHRALMLSGIAEGVSEITGFLASEDCLATLSALLELGVSIEHPHRERVIVHGVGMHGLRPASGPLNMGNAGTAMRLMMGLTAGRSFESTLIGDPSLMRRPMERVAVPLRLMGAGVLTHEGRPPVRMLPGGRLGAIDYELPVPSAQVKSAILLAALRADGRTRVTEPAPTRDHTERMLATFGVELVRGGRAIALEGGQALRAAHIEVPGDFSSAAFFLVAGCLAAQEPLTLENVGVNPTRTGLIELLREMGADIRIHPRAVQAPSAEPTADLEVRASNLRGIKVPQALVPLAIDEFPVFFIAAACAEGDTLVRGALELRVKESDRLAAMAEGLGRLGVEHDLLPDGLWIRGRGGLTGGALASYGDHRIAMAFAVASLRAAAPIEILDVANVGTSFPGFVATARSAGLRIEEF
ncbi:MAG TPA: 3-phosphoshikimate 1-carboxyvinyltransferase [Steroidobacteraceae bacterium]|nr:3-phosphoshikimate 1-carboxyvinyltransferase [Steroidobacteraceae bacterium]